MQWLSFGDWVMFFVAPDPQVSVGPRVPSMKSVTWAVIAHWASVPRALTTVIGFSAPQAVCGWPFNVIGPGTQLDPVTTPPRTAVAKFGFPYAAASLIDSVEGSTGSRRTCFRLQLGDA